jgi:transposase
MDHMCRNFLENVSLLYSGFRLTEEGQPG